MYNKRNEKCTDKIKVVITEQDINYHSKTSSLDNNISCSLFYLIGLTDIHGHTWRYMDIHGHTWTFDIGLYADNGLRNDQWQILTEHSEGHNYLHG